VIPCLLLGKLLAPPPPAPPRPITPSLKNEICLALDPAKTEPVCSNDDAPMAIDIYPLFEKKFRLGETTYEDVFSLLDSDRLEEVTPFYKYSDYHQFDLTGTGVNPIVIYRGYQGDITSIVFVRPDVLTPVSEDTVIDLCSRLELRGDIPPCNKSKVVYAQDFFPIIYDRFWGKPGYERVFLPLAPYEYAEDAQYYKLYYYFDDNLESRVLFYFDKNKHLENLAFVALPALTPLDAHVLTDLCRNLKLSPNNSKCKSGTKIYITDFEEEVRKAFPIGSATYEDVQAALGKYQYRFDYPVRDANGKVITLSWYDFVGNNSSTIRFDFDINFVVTQIYFFSGGGRD
jgi:hypothetical protein